MAVAIRVNGKGMKLLRAVQSFSLNDRACAKVGVDVSEFFVLALD